MYSSFKNDVRFPFPPILGWILENKGRRIIIWHRWCMCEVLPCTLPPELSLEMKRHNNIDLEVLRNLRGTEIVLCVPWYRQTMVGGFQRRILWWWSSIEWKCQYGVFSPLFQMKRSLEWIYNTRYVRD